VRGRAAVLDLLFALLVTAVIAVLCAKTQLPFSRNGGRGDDGDHYYRLAELLRGREHPRGNEPFVARVGVPLMVASLREKPLLEGFRLVGVASSFVAAVLMSIWLRLHVGHRTVRWSLLVFFVAHWLGPLRLTFWIPTLTDATTWCVYLMVLVLTEHWVRTRARWAIGGLIVVAIGGTIVRDSTVIACATIPFATNPLPDAAATNALPAQGMFGPLPRLAARFVRRFEPLLFLPAILALSTQRALSRSIWVVGRYDLLGNARDWFYGKSIAGMFLAWAFAYGPLLAVLVHYRRDVKAILLRRQYLAAWLVAFAVVGWFLGSDSERLTFWTLPVVAILVGRIAEERPYLLRSWTLLATVVVLVSLTSRWWWPISDAVGVDPPELRRPWIIGSTTSFVHLMSYHGQHRGLDLQAVEHSVLLALLMVWLLIVDLRARARAGAR